MLTRILPALCAVLLLAACGSDTADQTTAPASDMASLQGTNNGGGVDSGALGNNGGESPGTPGEFKSAKVGDTIHFDTDSISLNSDAQAVLQRQAVWLKQYPQHTVTIEGHADERGTREYNLALGERRAQTALNYLVALGIDPQRLKEISYGKERPVCPDTGEACWAQNRRDVTTLDN